MSEKIVEFNVEIIRGQIKELVRGSVEETQNELLEKEKSTRATAAGAMTGCFTTTSGDVTLHSCGSGTCPSKQLSQGIAVSGENGAALLF